MGSTTRTALALAVLFATAAPDTPAQAPQDRGKLAGAWVLNRNKSQIPAARPDRPATRPAPGRMRGGPAGRGPRRPVDRMQAVVGYIRRFSQPAPRLTIVVNEGSVAI